MDFALTEDLQAVADLADRVLGEHGDPSHLRAVEAAGGHDDRAWQALVDTGLLGVAVPEAHGGAGMGWLAAHLLAESAGRHVAHVPLVEVVTAATVLAAAGDPSQLLPSVVAGTTLPVLAVQDVGASAWDPVTVLDGGGEDARVTGTKVVVPWAARADHLLVTATPREGGAPRLALVSAGDAQVEGQHLSTDVPHATVELAHAPARVLGDDRTVAWALDIAVSALASHQAGMLDAAVGLAARYTSDREQFGRPIATFQAVSQRVAGAFVDAECARLAALQAAWRLDEGLPATDEVAIAKWWAAEAGHRVLHAAQHVHGGVGVDREYPLHRYLLRTKQVEFALGSAADQLGRLGASLAADPA